MVEQRLDVEGAARVQEHETIAGLDGGGTGKAQIDQYARADLLGHEP